MGCIDRGDLRAFLDGELTAQDRAQVECHLKDCADCSASLDMLRSDVLFTRSALDRLVPAAPEVPMPHWSVVRERAGGKIRRPVTSDEGFSSMFGNLLRLIGGSRMRMAATTAATVAIVALLFTMTPVQTLAGSLLSVFRVQKFAAIQVDPGSLPDFGSPDDLGTFKQMGDPKPVKTTLAEAEKQVGFKVMVPSTLPAGLEPNPRVTVVEAQSITFTPDLKKVRAYLASIGASDVKLPDNLDGAPITLQVSPQVTALYLERGGADTDSSGRPIPMVGQKFLYLGATKSPTMDVPDGINLEQLRSELLKMPGLPPDLVNQLKAVNDWQNTMVVPVVKGTSRDVTVQGEKGLLITQADGKSRSLMWVKGDVVYVLSGSVSEAEILESANSLK